MTPSQPAPSAESTPLKKLRLGVYALLGVLSLGTFAWKLDDAPFVDEYADISQSYYADLLIEGRRQARAWLEAPAYDLVPLPKYLIGLALRATGEPRPGPEAARAWYRDTSSRFGTPWTLTAARIPSVLLGAVGCVALAAIGATAFDRRVGVAAALLLMLNPLYALHAHRAMSEAPCEAFLLVALATFLVAWKRTLQNQAGWAAVQGLSLAAGAAVALSVLAKFNGLLALMTIPAWLLLAWATMPNSGRGVRKLLAGGVTLACTAAAGFLVLNPYMTARPAPPLSPEMQEIADRGIASRFKLLIDHRRAMSAGQQEIFRHNALTSLEERIKVVAAQGFGRFGPFGPAKSDSTIRYDVKQDWGAYGWLPLGLAGLGYAAAVGRLQRRSGEPPTAWAATAWALISLVVVTVYIPMAWDRYLLPIQAPFALMAAAALVGAWDALKALRKPGAKPEPS